MTPEEIEATEFFVGMRGYEKSEVRDFLMAVAAEQRALLERVAELEAGAPAPAADPIDELGRQVTAVVRTAQEAGRALVAEAEQSAADMRSSAERDVRRAEEEAAAARRDAEAQRLEGERLLAEARTEAARLVEEGARRAEEEAAEIVSRAGARRAEVEAACEDMLTRLGDAVTGAQMSLLVLRPGAEAAGSDEQVVDVREGEAPAEEDASTEQNGERAYDG